MSPDRNVNIGMPFAITLQTGSSLANKTGSWRSERPVYVDLLPPCNKACPAGENIQGWLYHAEEGDYEAAWREIMVDNPLPAVMGRVCYHTCQTACNRAEVDEAVGINAIERFLGDRAIEESWQVEPVKDPSGRKVLVVGSGPSGLSAAYHLARLGHEVTVRDQGEKPGGMMRYGIPSYRLPRHILDAEIARIAALGVTFEQGVTVTDVDAELELFDAVFTAVGAQLARNVEVPAGSAATIMNAVDLLRDGKIDAMFYTVGIGASAITEAAQTAPIDLVSIAADKADELHDKYPFYTPITVPGGTYPGIDEDVPTITTQAMMVVAAELSDDDVYTFMDTIFGKNLDKFYNDVQNPNLKKYFKVETALDGMPIPVHPGAIRFFKEQGVKVDDSLVPS